MLPRFLQISVIFSLAAAVLVGAFVIGSEFVVAPSRYVPLPVNDDRNEPITEKGVITFVGDMMFAREVERALMANGVDWPFALIKDKWKDSHLVVGNYESTIRDTYRNEGSVLAFDVIPELNAGLKNAGFTHLSLANNHGDDFGAEVTAYTREKIAELGIVPFGDPAESELHVVRTEANGIPVSLTGFHAFSEYPHELDKIIAAEDAAGQFVIVFPHWGNEYQFLPSPAQKEAAQIFIAAGADLIIGAHPHVVEPIELINGVPVAWSLGNFIFDQDWSRETMEGLMLHVTLSHNDIAINVVPVDIKNRQAAVMTSDRKQIILEAIGVPEGTITFPLKDQTPSVQQ